MLTPEAMRAEALDWVDAWNQRDLDRIMQHYAEDVTFQGATVVARWGRPDGRLLGKEELRRHFVLGLQISPDLRFDFEQVLFGLEGYCLWYGRENGNRVAETVRFDADGRIVECSAYYLQSSA